MLTLDELDRTCMAYADRYTAAIAAACDEVAQHQTTPEARAAVSRLKVSAATNIYDIATTDDPYAKMLDMLMMVSLQDQMWGERRQAVEQFGPSGMHLALAFDEMRREIWDLAARIQPVEQLAMLDHAIVDWQTEHPEAHYVSMVRFEDVMRGHGKSSMMAEMKSASGLLSAVNDLDRTANEFRLLGERAFFIAKRQPTLLNWQLQAAADEMLAREEVRDLVQAAVGTERLVDVAERALDELPAEMTRQQVELRLTLSEVERTLKSAEPVLHEVRMISENGSEMITSLNRTMATMQGTLDSADQLATHMLDRPEPVRIEQYTAAATELTQALSELNKVVQNSDALVGSQAWRVRLDDVNEAAEQRVDHIFWRGVWLVAVLLGMLLVYRLTLMGCQRKFGG